MISEISLRLLFFAEFAREILQRGRLDQRDETRTRSGKKYVINTASTCLLYVAILGNYNFFSYCVSYFHFYTGS